MKNMQINTYNRQHQSQLNGQQHNSQCHNVTDVVKARAKTSQKYQHTKEKRSLTQRKEFAFELGKIGRTISGAQISFFYSQGYNRAFRRNKYTIRSARTKIQKNRPATNTGFSEEICGLKSIKTLTFPHLYYSCNSVWHLNSTFNIMLTMLVVATVVISGNDALAAQKDSFKIKDTKTVSNNANSIPTGSYVANSGSDNSIEYGNGNTVSANSGDTNTINNGNYAGTIIGINVDVATQSTGTTKIASTTNVINQTMVTTMAAMISTSTSAASKATASVSNSNTIASGSLQKANSVSVSSPSGNIGINRNVIEIMEDTRSGPYFDKAASKNVTALLGKTAYLNCRVKNLGNKTMLLQVSWVRHRDIHLLTVGRYTYTSDQRFRAIHQPQTEDWILQIKYPQHRDSGIYECQVSTTPHMSHYIHLNVVEPSTEIIGAPDLYIESGSTINLTCVILNSPEPPAYIFWNHNNAIINYDSPRGGVSVVTNKGETTTSFLLIKSARPSDSGLYQCNPSNAKPKSVTVHVLNGEFPAAMQRAGQSLHRMSPNHYLLVYLLMYLFTLVYVGRYTKLSSQPMLLQKKNSKNNGSIQMLSEKEVNKVVR